MWVIMERSEEFLLKFHPHKIYFCQSFEFKILYYFRVEASVYSREHSKL